MREATVTDADDAAVVLHAGALRAVVHPARGMLVSSLRRGGAEFLRLADNVRDAAVSNRLVGLPLLHPWANRLDGLRYAACGRTVTLPSDSPLLRYDDNGLPNHGVTWSRLPFAVASRDATHVDGVLRWDRPEWLALFPFPHRLHLRIALTDDALRVDATLHATGEIAVPACFGFHPYLGLPGSTRDEWRLRTPPLRHLRTDARLIPTGEARAFDGIDAPLSVLDLDDGYALGKTPAHITLSDARDAIGLEIGQGYAVLQVYAPRGAPYVCLEPMVAPANALGRGADLRCVASGASFRTSFALRIGPAPLTSA